MDHPSLLCFLQFLPEHIRCKDELGAPISVYIRYVEWNLWLGFGDLSEDI